jgi:hypothetical protein
VIVIQLGRSGTVLGLPPRAWRTLTSSSALHAGAGWSRGERGGGRAGVGDVTRAMYVGGLELYQP